MTPPAHAPTGPARDHRGTLAVAARLAVGIVFVVSGFPKVVAPAEEFAAVIEAYFIPGLTPAAMLWTARVLPWVEVIVGVWLATGYRVRLSAAAALGMLGVFLLGLGSAVARGVPLEHCGCFGAALPLSPSQAMAFDLALAAGAVLAWRRGGERLSLDRWIEAGAP